MLAPASGDGEATATTDGLGATEGVVFGPGVVEHATPSAVKSRLVHARKRKAIKRQKGGLTTSGKRREVSRPPFRAQV
jgi:hypothetical protein